MPDAADALFRLGIVLLVTVPWLWFFGVQVLPWRKRVYRVPRPAAPSIYWRAVLWCLSKVSGTKRRAPK